MQQAAVQEQTTVQCSHMVVFFMMFIYSFGSGGIQWRLTVRPTAFPFNFLIFRLRGFFHSPACTVCTLCHKIVGTLCDLAICGGTALLAGPRVSPSHHIVGNCSPTACVCLHLVPLHDGRSISALCKALPSTNICCWGNFAAVFLSPLALASDILLRCTSFGKVFDRSSAHH